MNFKLFFKTRIFKTSVDLSVNPITKEGSSRVLISVIRHLVGHTVWIGELLIKIP